MGNIYGNDAYNNGRKEKKISGSAVARIVIWSVVFFLLVGVFAAAMLGNFLGGALFAGGRIHLGDWYFDDDFNVGNGVFSGKIRELSIDWVAGSVTVMATDGEEIRITEDYDGDDDAYSLRWQAEDGKLSVKYCKPTIKTALFGSKAPSKNLTVLIPEALLNELDEIQISTVSASQDVRVSARELDIETVSGKTTISGDYDAVEIETVSGNVDLKGYVKRATFEGVSARIELSLRAQAERVSLETVSGDMRLILPESTTGFRVDTDSLSGSTEIRGFDGGTSKTWGDGSMKIDVDRVSGKLIIEKETKD